jgi:cytochrome P450
VKKVTVPSPDQFNPLSPQTVENPYDFYRAMREEAPVYAVPGGGFFIVSRYEDAKAHDAGQERLRTYAEFHITRAQRTAPRVRGQLSATALDHSRAAAPAPHSGY